MNTHFRDNEMRHFILIGWLVAITALITMIAGHQGVHSLNWKIDQISTYAAIAPYDYFITASMLLSSILLLVIGIIVAKTGIVGDSLLAYMISPITGTAAAGLIMLSYYEETARNLITLKKSGFWSVRIQSFHDAGLMIFFYGTAVLIFALGLLIVLHRKSMSDKITGTVILFLGPLSFLLMKTPWPGAIGLQGGGPGIKQRASLLFLWLGAILFLILASRSALKGKGSGVRPGNVTTTGQT